MAIRLKEKYDLIIEIPPPLDSEDRDPRPRIIEAVRQVGLEFKGGKVMVQMLVVDNVQKAPTPN